MGAHCFAGKVRHAGRVHGGSGGCLQAGLPDAPCWDAQRQGQRSVQCASSSCCASPHGLRNQFLKHPSPPHLTTCLRFQTLRKQKTHLHHGKSVTSKTQPLPASPHVCDLKSFTTTPALPRLSTCLRSQTPLKPTKKTPLPASPHVCDLKRLWLAAGCWAGRPICCEALDGQLPAAPAEQGCTRA